MDAPWLHLPTWITLTAAINAAIALAMIASSPRRSPLLREAPQAWQRGIAILSLGWLLLAYRDHWPDAISLIGANTLLALGVAECVRALRRFAGLGEAVVPLAAIVAAVFAVSVVFGLIWPSRFLRLSFNTLAIAVLFLAGARAALRAPSEVRIGNRLVVGGIFAAAGLAALLRVTVFVLHGEDAMPPPDAFTPEQLLFYLLFGLGPPAASLAFVLMGNDRLITELSRLAGEDPLTGLGNRRQFDQAAQSLLARPRTHPVALLLLDIDRFKAINDLHGHAAGDEVLRAFGALLRRESDGRGAVLGRLGGEEFGLLLAVPDHKAAWDLAERLRLQSRLLAPGGIRFTVSIGVVVVGPEVTALPTLMQAADDLLYRAKREGRDGVRLARIHPPPAPVEVLP